MSMDNTITQQGRFKSAGTAKILQVRSDIDWMRVYNWTTHNAAGAGTAVEGYWQRGMAADNGIVYVKTAVTNAIATASYGVNGFTLLDTSGNPMGPLNATVTQISGAAPPLVSATSTAGLVDGDVVRIIGVGGAVQFGGMDFTIGNLVANTQFELTYAPTIVTTGATTGNFYPIKWDPIYYPTNRYITAITQAAHAVVTFSVTHGYTVGQKLRFHVGENDYGMGQIDGLLGNIIAIDTANNTVTVDIDSTTFTAFAFPLTAVAAIGFTPAHVVPVGEDTRTARTVAGGIELRDATDNIAYIGMRLGAGTGGAAGIANDIIYWVAGKSFSNLDEV